MNLTTIVAILAFGLLTVRYATRLSETEGRYRQLFDNIEDAIFLLSLKPPAIREELSKLIRGHPYPRLHQGGIAAIFHGPADFPAKVPRPGHRHGKIQADRWVLYEAVQVTRDGHKIPVEIKAHLFELEGATRFWPLPGISRNASWRKKNSGRPRPSGKAVEEGRGIVPGQPDLKREITERQEAEQALRESENQLHHLTAQLLAPKNGSAAGYRPNCTMNWPGPDAAKIPDHCPGK